MSACDDNAAIWIFYFAVVVVVVVVADRDDICRETAPLSGILGKRT